MGLGSLSSFNNLSTKANNATNKVLQSTNSAMGLASQILRRFPTPQDVSNLPDPLKNNQWEAIFPSFQIPQGVGYRPDYTPIPEEIVFQLPNIETYVLNVGPSQIKLPKTRTSATEFTATFYCDANASIINYYTVWRQLVVHEDFLVGVPSEYKKPVYLYILGVRSVIPLYLIKFRGVYPIKITMQNAFKYSTPVQRVTATITFSCDSVSAEPLPAGQAMALVTNTIVGKIIGQAGSVSALASKFM